MLVSDEFSGLASAGPELGLLYSGAALWDRGKGSYKDVVLGHYQIGHYGS